MRGCIVEYLWLMRKDPRRLERVLVVHTSRLALSVDTTEVARSRVRVSYQHHHYTLGHRINSMIGLD